MHVRMQSQENVEISNPMYLREDADEDVESLDPTFVIASNKVIYCRLACFLHFNDYFCSHRRPISLILSTSQCITMWWRVVASTRRRKVYFKANRHTHSNHTRITHWPKTGILLRRFLFYFCILQFRQRC
jgi:hypothetical protein